MGSEHEALPWIKIFPSPGILAMTRKMTDGAKCPFSQHAPVGLCLSVTSSAPLQSPKHLQSAFSSHRPSWQPSIYGMKRPEAPAQQMNLWTMLSMVPSLHIEWSSSELPMQVSGNPEL